MADVGQKNALVLKFLAVCSLVALGFFVGTCSVEVLHSGSVGGDAQQAVHGLVSQQELVEYEQTAAFGQSGYGRHMLAAASADKYQVCADALYAGGLCGNFLTNWLNYKSGACYTYAKGAWTVAGIARHLTKKENFSGCNGMAVVQVGTPKGFGAYVDALLQIWNQVRSYIPFLNRAPSGSLVKVTRTYGAATREDTLARAGLDVFLANGFTCSAGVGWGPTTVGEVVVGVAVDLSALAALPAKLRTMKADFKSAPASKPGKAKGAALLSDAAWDRVAGVFAKLGELAFSGGADFALGQTTSGVFYVRLQALAGSDGRSYQISSAANLPDS